MKHFATVMCMAFAATALAPSVRPLAVAEETKAEMARYGAVFSRGQSPVDSDAELPRFVEVLDKCEDMWSAGKYDELCEYVDGLEQKAPAYLPARFIFAFNQGRFGLYENRVAELRRLTNQVSHILCEVNPELLPMVGLMTADAEVVADRFVALKRERKNEDPRSMVNKKDLSKLYWPLYYLEVPFLVPDQSLCETHRVAKCAKMRPRNRALKAPALAMKVGNYFAPEELYERITYCQKKEMLDDYVAEIRDVSGVEGLVGRFIDAFVRLDGYLALKLLRDNSKQGKQILKDYVLRANPPLEGEAKLDWECFSDEGKRMAVWALLQFAHDDPEVAEYLRQLPSKIDKRHYKTLEYLKMAIKHLDDGCNRHFLEKYVGGSKNAEESKTLDREPERKN